MKYSKPDLHLINTTIAEPRCVDGSGATSAISCSSGTDFWDISCGSGNAAQLYCTLFGGAASATCSFGDGEGDACYSGT